jgi:uncharacterized protein (TIGR03437 family)
VVSPSIKYLSILVAFGALCRAQPPEQDVDDKQEDREEWFYNQRAFPAGQIPAGARIKAIADIQQIDRAARLRRRSAAADTPKLATALDAATWTSIGPQPTGLGSTYVTSGRVNAIAVDPRDNNTVYIGAAEGGVWKTTDGGQHWTPLTDDQASLASGAIALDPSNPDTVYVGTGEENFAQDSYYGAGILKSTDGGASWTNIVGPFLRDKIGSIAVHPSNGQIVLCSSGLGVWRSADGGASWTRVVLGIGTSVLFDPTDGNIAYAAIGSVVGSALNGVYRSTDAGQTWQVMPGSGANALPLSTAGRIQIAIAPSTPATLYAALQNASGNNLLGIYKTTDSGGTWNSTNAPDICPAPVTQCWYDMTLAVDPKNPDVVFAGGSLVLLRTQDGGASWNTLSFIGPNRVQIHVDEHNMAFTPDGSKLYVVNDGGAYSTTDITNSPLNWTELNDTLGLTQFYPGLSINPADANLSLGGAQDNGTQLYRGQPSWSNVTCGDGGYTAIDPVVPSIAYAACQNIQIFRTGNGGTTWLRSQYGINAQDRVNFIAPLVIDPSNSQTLYFGTYRMWQTLDGGGKWVAISPDLTGRSSATIRAIGVAPSDRNVVYAASSEISRVSTGSGTTRLQMTSNALSPGGATWTDRTAGLPQRMITQIAVDPIDAQTAYATFSGFSSITDSRGHIFKTSDGGASWTDISGNLPDVPVDDVVVDPDVPDTLYIGTDAGVMVTTDGGATWSSLGNGLPRVVVHSLVMQRKSRILRAATHGRSMWDILVPLSSGSLQPSIDALTPSTANAGSGDFQLAVTGSNFGAGSVLRWNGISRSTKVVDSSHLTAQITGADVAQVGRVSVDVLNPSRGGGASLPKLFTIGPAPSTVSAAFVSAANPAGGSALAPGSIGSLFGTNLAGITSVADGLPPLPSMLGGTSLSITGAALPLFFVSPGQINFQVPWATGINQPAPFPLTVTAGSLSTSVIVTLTPYSPALFTTNSQGTGQASVLISGTASVAAPVGAIPGSRPARIGEFISIYCTGLGDVNRRPTSGSASPSNPVSMTLATPIVTVGSVPATVSFSGLAPGFVGLYQVNVQIPNNAPTGAAVPLSLSIGGVAANTATIAIE